MKKFRYLIEAGLLWSLFVFFRLLSPPRASAIGGWIGRTIGPRLGSSKKAYGNLQLSFPEKTPDELAHIVKGTWDNLGRNIAEYPHLLDIIRNRCEIVGEEYVDAIGEHNRCIVIGAHIANWELGPFYFNHRKKWPLAGIYREPNNPYVAKILTRMRNPEPSGKYIAKSRSGVRDMVRVLENGGRLANLIDQKYNQGVAVPFMGRPAMTSTAFAQLAERFDCPLVPLRVIRLPDCRFRIVIEQPFKTNGMGHEAALRKCNLILERWINEEPAQWLWLHRRWNSRALKDGKANPAETSAPHEASD